MSIVGTNRIMAERKADLLHNSRNSQPVANFSRKSSGLVCNNLYPVTEFDNESSALPCLQPSNTSKLTAFKRRSYAVNALYNNVMHKRNSTGILSIEHNKPDNGDSKSKSQLRPNSRLTPMINATSSINVSFNNDSQSQKSRNPINHYEQNMNFALRPKSSSTVDLATSHQPELPERSYSAHNLRKVISSKSNDNEANESVPGKENDNRNESDSEDNNTEDEVLCDQIADALRDDLFHKEVTFDNKWAEATGLLGAMEDHHSTTSSNQSPLTETLKSGLRNGLSRRDSIILEDFEKDLTAVISATRNSRSSEDAGPKAGSRLQLKLDTLKLQFESVQHDFEGPISDSLTAISNSADCQLQSHNKSPAQSNFKFWATNIDLKTKIVSDKITRELKAVRRCAVEDNNVNGKVIASKVNRILAQNHSQGRMFAPSREVKQLEKEPPLVKTVNSTHSDVAFSKNFENTRKERNTDDMFQKKALQVINDEKLRDSILHGRDSSSRIWLEYERLEFN